MQIQSLNASPTEDASHWKRLATALKTVPTGVTSPRNGAVRHHAPTFSAVRITVAWTAKRSAMAQKTVLSARTRTVVLATKPRTFLALRKTNAFLCKSFVTESTIATMDLMR